MNLPVIESCEGCGACCMVIGLPPYLDEIDLVPIELQREFYAQKEAGGDREGQPCFWLDLTTRRCTHYEDRPNLCREYPVGEEDCQEARRNAAAR